MPEEVRFALPGPVDEADRQLEGSAARDHPVPLVDAALGEEAADRWHGRLADADDPNVRRLDQGDSTRATGRAAQGSRQPERRKPPRRPATHDHDLPDL